MGRLPVAGHARARGETVSGLCGYGGRIEVDGVGGHGYGEGGGCSRSANPILGLLLPSSLGIFAQVVGDSQFIRYLTQNAEMRA